MCEGYYENILVRCLDILIPCLFYKKNSRDANLVSPRVSVILSDFNKGFSFIETLIRALFAVV